MREALLLVFANKQDIPGGELSCIPNWKENTEPLCTAMKVPEVIERLELTKLSAKELKENRRERIWSVMPSVATSGDGLFEGLVSTGLSLG